jgi:hypothetical protein
MHPHTNYTPWIFIQSFCAVDGIFVLWHLRVNPPQQAVMHTHLSIRILWSLRQVSDTWRACMQPSGEEDLSSPARAAGVGMLTQTPHLQHSTPHSHSHSHSHSHLHGSASRVAPDAAAHHAASDDAATMRRAIAEVRPAQSCLCACAALSFCVVCVHLSRV